MLHEILRKQITVSKQEDTSLSWNNFVLGISGYKNLHLIDFTYNLQCLEKTVDIKEYSINATYNSPVPTNFLSNYAAQGIKNMELMEIITNPAFWPHHNMLAQEMTNIIACKWSPENLIGNHNQILTTINSVGNVEFFVFYEHEWVSILNFSTEMKNHLNVATEMLNKCPKSFDDMKNIVYSLETSTVCWAPKLNNDNSCYLATVQKSGEILFWLLDYKDNSLQTRFCNSIKNSNTSEVPNVIWIPQSEENFLLIFSSENGQVMANKFDIVDKKIILVEEYNIWSHKDKMMVTYLDYNMYDNDKLLIIFNKNRHLVIQMYDNTFILLSQCVKNINDYKITCITKSQGEFYVGTVNVKLYKIIYSLNNNVIDFTLKLIELKESYPKSDLFGVSFSTNNAMCAMGIFDRNLLVRKQTFKIYIIFMCDEAEIETSALAILNNTSKKIINVWDHIEVLRCKVIKLKKLPDIDYNELLKAGEFDIYKLKVYLVFLSLYQSLDKMMTPCLKGLMPETSIEVIKEKILFFQCLIVIDKLHTKYEKEKLMTDFEKECFDCCKRFIYMYCNKYEKTLTDNVAENKLQVPCGQIEYICQACDEIIIDFACKNKHRNMFCSLTLTPIERDEYLICRCCRSTARIELFDQRPSCVFCDVCLNKSI